MCLKDIGLLVQNDNHLGSIVNIIKEGGRGT